nr:AMP-binding protein [Tamaricihabitans halophyticus]
MPGRPAIIDGDRWFSYAELDAAATRFASALIARGVRAGDRAAIWAPNTAEWVIAALGMHAAGAILVPINTRFRGAEASYALRKVGATVLVVQDGFLDTGYLAMVRESLGSETGTAPAERSPVPGIPTLHTVVTTDDRGDDSVWPFDRFLELADNGHSAEVDRRIATLRGKDVADILFTSGTTGYPKGAMVSHRANLVVNAAWSDMVGLEPADRYLLVNPFFHSFGYRAGILACLIRRATMIPLPVFDVDTALRAIARERVTVFPGAPAVYSAILAHPRLADYDIGSVRLAVTGATVVPVPLLRSMRTELGFRDVITAYGLTETCGTVTVCPPDTDEDRLSTSCGKAIPGTEVIVVDAANQRLPAGETGEILVRGDNVMLGYYADQDATDAAIDSAGWLRTGDIGWLDSDGYLRVTDRLKDMFVVGGFNVYPAEVERLLAEHPAVSEVAVVGMPDERLGEVGHAYVVRRRGVEPTEDELIEHCRAIMANFKVPRKVSFCPELPRTASGKVQKFRLGAAG